MIGEPLIFRHPVECADARKMTGKNVSHRSFEGTVQSNVEQSVNPKPEFFKTFVEWKNRRPSFPGRCFLASIAFSVAGLCCVSQEQRPALIPSSQGSGSTGAASASAAANIGGLTDEPIFPGQILHVFVFNAPDFSEVTRVSESGNIAIPMLGSIHVGGLASADAADLIADRLKTANLMLAPNVTVTVDSSSAGITILGEVHAPGIYPPPGKHLLSDLLATAGGLTSNAGRVIEISNDRTPENKIEVPWDPTMHNTSNYDRPVHPGDRILVRACGIAYIGGHVLKPGAYSLCGSPQITLSEAISLAGGETPLTAERHTYLIRSGGNGTRIVQEIDIKKVLTAKAADPVLKEDDIIYVTPSTVKDVLNRATAFALTVSNTLFYNYHP